MPSIDLTTLLPGWINARDYGAVGDGNHDDAPAIQSALTAASANGGGVVILPAGTYLLNSSPSFSGLSNVSLWVVPGASTTGTGSLPSSTGTNVNLTLGDFATLTGTETLTNKTLTSPTLTSPTISSGVLSQDDTTDASSTTTGSIHTDGGLGVAKRIYRGTEHIQTGNATFTSLAELTSLTAHKVSGTTPNRSIRVYWEAAAEAGGTGSVEFRIARVTNNTSVNTIWYKGNNSTTAVMQLDHSNQQLRMAAGSVSLPAYSFGADPNTGIYSAGADLLGLVTGGTERLRVNAGYSLTLLQATANYTLSWNDPSAARALTIPDPGADDTFVFLAATQTLTNKTLTSPTLTTPVIDQINDSNGNELVKFTATASAVNEITIANTATGSYPYFQASGDDPVIGINFLTKAGGTFRFSVPSATAVVYLDAQTPTGSTDIIFQEGTANRYTLGYNGNGNHFRLYKDINDAADIWRVNDTTADLSIDANTTWDANAFDWVCEQCSWHGPECIDRTCPECGAAVVWHDDAALLHEALHTPAAGQVWQMDRSKLAMLERLGVINTYGTLNQAQPEVYMSMQRFGWFLASAISQLWQRLQRLEAARA